MNIEQKFKTKTNLDFNTFYTKNRNVLVWHLMKMSKNLTEAEDIADDAMAKALEQLDTYDSTKSQFNTWLFTIAKRLMFYKLKQNGKYESVDKQHGEEEGSIADFLVADDPTEAFAYEVRLSKQTSTVATALYTLPSRYASVMVMRLVDGLSYQEITDYLGENLNTVKSRIREGKRLLSLTVKDIDLETDNELYDFS